MMNPDNDNGIEFFERFPEYVRELQTINRQGDWIEAAIKANLRELSINPSEKQNASDIECAMESIRDLLERAKKNALATIREEYPLFEESWMDGLKIESSSDILADMFRRQAAMLPDTRGAV